ncbi:MAG: hypothetical protein AAF742_08570 [Pseudomonadota bacterium]
MKHQLSSRPNESEARKPSRDPAKMPPKASGPLAAAPTFLLGPGCAFALESAPFSGMTRTGNANNELGDMTMSAKKHLGISPGRYRREVRT